jgi:hypothetical protein
MTHNLRFAAVAAFALLPLSAGSAQDSQPAPPPPAQQPADAPPAPAAQAQPQAPRTAAPAPRAAPAPEAAPADEADAPAPATRVRAVRRAPVRAVVVPPPPVATTSTTTTTTAVTPPVATVTTAPPATVPPTTAPTVLNAAPPTGVDTVTPPPPTRAQQPQLDQRTAVWPWFLLGALLIGAAALLLLNRRRGRTEVYENSYEPAPRVAEQVGAAPPVVVAPVAPEPAGVPAIALAMRPLRAGVEEGGARVEFELTVDNRGTGEARDVRVATWMLAAGASEAERALIAPTEAAADTPPLDIPAGEARTVEAQVAMPRGDIPGDALLPVVVADASYRLPDGSAGKVSARFAVGVPDGEELARFDAEHPSGLHEGVIAQTLGETEPV